MIRLNEKWCSESSIGQSRVKALTRLPKRSMNKLFPRNETASGMTPLFEEFYKIRSTWARPSFKRLSRMMNTTATLTKVNKAKSSLKNTTQRLLIKPLLHRCKRSSCPSENFIHKQRLSHKDILLVAKSTVEIARSCLKDKAVVAKSAGAVKPTLRVLKIAQ